MNHKTLKFLFALGTPLSPLYSQLMKARAVFFKKGIFKSFKLDVPVISVGNITMGGTGKTPLVIYLSRLLLANGYKPAVISRGYRGKSQNSVNIVSDGTSILLNADQAGDEPFLIASSVEGVVVVTGRNRIHPCRTAIDTFQCNVIILDDGFQHLKIKREIDLVLFDTISFAGNSRVFPGGDLREPVNALNRGTCFILTGVNRSINDRAEKCENLLKKRFPGKKVFKTSVTHKHAIHHAAGQTGIHRSTIPLNQLPEKLFCFCGIANPGRFKESIVSSQLDEAGYMEFPDHHSYSDSDIENIVSAAKECNSSALLTTEKDMVKITDIFPPSFPVFSLPLEIDTCDELENEILHLLKMAEAPDNP